MPCPVAAHVQMSESAAVCAAQVVALPHWAGSGITGDRPSAIWPGTNVLTTIGVQPVASAGGGPGVPNEVAGLKASGEVAMPAPDDVTIGAFGNVDVNHVVSTATAIGSVEPLHE